MKSEILNDTNTMAERAPLHIVRSYPVSASRMFDAWTRPDIMKKWLFKSPTNHLTVDVDLEEGGKLIITEREGDREIEHSGEYLKLSQPELLVFTLAATQHLDIVSVVRVDIEGTGDTCTLSMTQTNIDVTRTEASWEQMFDNLSALIQSDLYDGQNSSADYYEASSAKQSALIRIALDKYSIPYRAEHVTTENDLPAERFHVGHKNESWLFKEVACLDLKLEEATDADLLRRFDDTLATTDPHF